MTTPSKAETDFAVPEEPSVDLPSVSSSPPASRENETVETSPSSQSPSEPAPELTVPSLSDSEAPLPPAPVEPVLPQNMAPPAVEAPSLETPASQATSPISPVPSQSVQHIEDIVTGKQPPAQTRLEEKTIVVPPEVAELQAQIEIAITQIKSLNKKVHEIEEQMDLMGQHVNVHLEANELKEPPMNPAEFTQKLLKLAEHVIVLEKELARLRSGEKHQKPFKNPTSAQTPAPPPPPPGRKPPIMPL